jgi:hypothetical protein
MAEPVSTIFGGLSLSNIASGIAGLFGGVSISIFYQPKPIREKGKFCGGAIVGAISFGFPFMFGGAVLGLLGVDVNHTDYKTAIDTILGAISVGLVSFVATWLEKREGKDIGEVIKDAKKDIKDTL